MCGRLALYSSFQAIKDYADLLNDNNEIVTYVPSGCVIL